MCSHLTPNTLIHTHQGVIGRCRMVNSLTRSRHVLALQCFILFQHQSLVTKAEV